LIADTAYSNQSYALYGKIQRELEASSVTETDSNYAALQLDPVLAPNGNTFTHTSTAGSGTSFKAFQSALVSMPRISGSGTAAISNAIGLRVGWNGVTTNTGTNKYGIYVDGLSGATNNYALFTNAGKVQFGDTVTLNSSTLNLGTSLETFNVNSPAASGTNASAASSQMTFNAAQGTGTGQGGSFLFNVAPPGSSGASANPLTQVLWLLQDGTFQIGRAGLTTQTSIIGGNVKFDAGAGNIARIRQHNNDASLFLIGGNGETQGANIQVYGPSHATLANVTRFSVGETVSASISSAGIFNITGKLGIGATPSANTSTLITGAGLSGTDQRGLIVDTVFQSDATGTGYSVSGQVQTAIASFTLGAASAFRTIAASLGAGSSVTRLMNYYGVAQTAGTNNAFLSDNLSFTGNYFINQSGTTASVFGGSVTAANLYAGSGSIGTPSLGVGNGGGFYSLGSGNTGYTDGSTNWLQMNSSGLKVASGSAANALKVAGGISDSAWLGMYVDGSGNAFAVNTVNADFSLGTNSGVKLLLDNGNSHVLTGALAASGALSGSNLSGTNTGDVTIGTANGLSLAGQALSLQAASDSVPGAMTAADHTAFTGLKVEQIDGMIESASAKTYVLRLNAKYAATVNEITLKTASGTITEKLQIDGVDVTSCTGISVTSSESTTSCTAANSLAAGNTLTLVTSSASSPVDLQMSVKLTR
jgi:hypothetical protein